MKKNLLKTILDHPDKDEIISKLVIDISPKDIHEWLDSKYSNIKDTNIRLSEKNLKSFKDNYLDLYNTIKDDLSKTKLTLSASNGDLDKELQLSLQNNSSYKNKMMELADNEIDIKKMLRNMILGIETRASQVFDSIQEDPRNINSRNDRLLREWFDSLGQNIERFNKIIIGAPDQVIQHNVTVQHIDQHVHAIQEALRLTLAELDTETSLRFMEIFPEMMSKLKPLNEKVELSQESRMAEVKVLNDTINKKLNDGSH